MSDLRDLLYIMWGDFMAPDVSYTERVVLFGIPVVIVLATVGLVIYAA